MLLIKLSLFASGAGAAGYGEENGSDSFSTGGEYESLRKLHFIYLNIN